MQLTRKHCVPCEGGMPPLGKKEAFRLLKQASGWSLNKKGHLTREFRFGNFVSAMQFLNRVAKIAEKEGHHPDFSVHYNRVEMEIWTHAIKGLSENDFMLAAKIDEVA